MINGHELAGIRRGIDGKVDMGCYEAVIPRGLAVQIR